MIKSDWFERNEERGSYLRRPIAIAIEMRKGELRRTDSRKIQTDTQIDTPTERKGTIKRKNITWKIEERERERERERGRGRERDRQRQTDRQTERKE